MNTTTRIGKIARLPHSIREQLNLKLHDGLPAKSILPWLNSLPEVKAILATDFDSRPITKQNLSEWKQGGHRDWLLLYHASHFLQFLDPSSSRREEAQTPSSDQTDAATDSSTDRKTDTHLAPSLSPSHGERIRGEGPDTQDLPNDFTHHASLITSRLLLWTQLQYTTMARHIDAETDPERKWTALRQFANEKKQLEFCKWIKRPDIADAIKNKQRGLTREELRKIEEEDLYLLGPDDPSLDEHIAQVHLAKELMARRKAKEAEAKRKPGDPVPEPPQINLRETTFDELFPTIPDKPLTELDLDEPKPEPQKSAPGSAGRAATDQNEVGRSVLTAPRQDTAPNPADIAPAPSDKSYKSDQSDSFTPALRSAPGEGGSNPVKPSQTQSNQIQPGSLLDPAPNPNHDSPF